MSVDALVGNYSWVNEIEGWTVSVMRSRPTAEVIRVYGRDQEVPLGDVPFADMDRHRGPDTGAVELFVQVVRHEQCTVTLEHNGWSGALPEIARRCSADGGWFFSVYWNIHAAGMVTQAIDGHITAQFEPLYPMTPDVQPGERRPAWAIGPEVELGLTRQVCMAQLEQQTGVAVRQEWLTEPLPTYRIPEPYWLYRDVEGADRI
ncbi:DUF6461 domain-containing protein [Actinophytocola glycyrrhizae]|uniref:DUF6461 domain-containing protein n=1 Tax=Actinophytocola glycyrrhizae TaxID=2044873 RepID=A0ABV9RTM4_9PSEU